MDDGDDDDVSSTTTATVDDGDVDDSSDNKFLGIVFRDVSYTMLAKFYFVLCNNFAKCELVTIVIR